jgi:hypothetical protein
MKVDIPAAQVEHIRGPRGPDRVLVGTSGYNP